MTLDLAMNSYNTKGIGNERKDKLDFMKIWNFYASKTLKRVRRQLTWYEKRFANHLSDNGLISKTYRELNETQQQKASNTTQKWTKDLNIHLTKEDIWITNKHVKRCSISLIIREMPNKSTMRHHFTPIRMTFIKNKSGLPLWASLVAQLVKKIHLQCWRPGLDPWVGKLSWRRERLPTPVFWPREFHGLYRPWGCRVRHDWVTFTFMVFRSLWFWEA